MDFARNNLLFSRVLARVLWALMLGCVVFASSEASAHVFAPMCDSSAASAMAPLPIYPREHGEIAYDPCAHQQLLVLEEQPSDRDVPSFDWELESRHAVPGQAVAVQLGPSPAVLRLATSTRIRAPRGHPGGVYRPPR